jgi:FAD/FMN-containing dehydrogenase
MLDQTHAWAEVFVPGAGRIAFDPTNRSVGGFILIPVAVARDIRLAMQRAVFGVVAKYGGSISAEHGIGIAKREWLPRVKDQTALEIMRSLKQTLDPNGILNPGKVL